MDPHNDLIRSCDGITTDRRRIFNCRNYIELPIVLIVFATMMSDGPITNIIMYRTCVHSLGYSVDRCLPFLKPGRDNSTHDIERDVQQYATFVTTVKSVLEAVLPAILSLFIVVWSDRHGRKPLLNWSMFGVTMTTFMVVGYSMMDKLGPWWFIVTSVPSLTGRYSIMLTGAICYVTDVTNERSRSMRLMLIQGLSGMGMAFGSLASPYVLHAVGAVYLFLTSAVLTTIGWAFTALYIKESVTNVEPGSILSVLDFSLVKDLFRETFKKRPNSMRAQILLVTTANSLTTFTFTGVAGLTYMYMREVLHWGLKDFTQFSSVSTAVSFIGSFFGIAVVQRVFKIGDLAFTIVAIITAVANNFIVAFAVADWEIYLGAFLSLLAGLSSPLLRSFISKVLPAEDITKVFALMSAIEGLCPLIAPLVFNALYVTTMATFPGAIFVVTGAGNIICVVILCAVAYIRWNVTSAYRLFDEGEA